MHAQAAAARNPCQAVEACEPSGGSSHPCKPSGGHTVFNKVNVLFFHGTPRPWAQRPGRWNQGAWIQGLGYKALASSTRPWVHGAWVRVLGNITYLIKLNIVFYGGLGLDPMACQCLGYVLTRPWNNLGSRALFRGLDPGPW